MPVTPTKTLNPLPFQDLEPHRFEDLVRQLAYDLRRWKSLEATGRGGSDDGLDIRGIELIPTSSESEDDENGEATYEERLWVFQCKRQKSLTPKEMKKVIAESLSSLEAAPDGFIIAIACDISKTTRDLFREEMVSRGIQEFFIWAKGELEDMLFQPKNDRLLFAYFGLSLHQRRQNLSTIIRSRIAKKKKITDLHSENDVRGTLILIRDPNDESYPYPPKNKKEKKKWLVCRLRSSKSPRAIAVIEKEHLAALSEDKENWDAILDYNCEEGSIESELQSKDAWSISRRGYVSDVERDFWNEYIPEDRRAFLKVTRFVNFDRILAIDPLGDGFYPIPHLFVEFDDQYGPFEEAQKAWLESTLPRLGRIDINLTKENRINIFPKPIPKLTDEIPSEFDQTIHSQVDLSTVNKDKFEKLLGSISEKRNLADIRKKEKQTTQKKDNPAKASFKTWRETIALPVLSQLVLQLRRDKHICRVAVRSSEPKVPYCESVESIEIKLKINSGGSLNNPDYMPSGHFKISWSEYRGLVVEIWPQENNNYGQRQAPPATIDQFSKEYLETQVLAIIERMIKDSL